MNLINITFQLILSLLRMLTIKLLIIFINMNRLSVIYKNFSNFSLSHWINHMHDVKKSGSWFEYTFHNILLEILWIKYSIIVYAYRHNYKIVFQLFKVIPRIEQMFNHIICLLWLIEFSIPWSFIILKNCGDRIILNHILHQSLVNIVYIDIILITSFC